MINKVGAVRYSVFCRCAVADMLKEGGNFEEGKK
jgi:hypothetical protein